MVYLFVAVDPDVAWRDNKMAFWGGRVLTHLFPRWQEASDWVSDWGGGNPNADTPEQMTLRGAHHIRINWITPGRYAALWVGP
jgi:hypothetical protein